jgi:uncharacterized membrane protein YfcA
MQPHYVNDQAPGVWRPVLLRLAIVAAISFPGGYVAGQVFSRWLHWSVLPLVLLSVASNVTLFAFRWRREKNAEARAAEVLQALFELVLYFCGVALASHF